MLGSGVSQCAKKEGCDEGVNRGVKLVRRSIKVLYTVFGACIGGEFSFRNIKTATTCYGGKCRLLQIRGERGELIAKCQLEILLLAR